MAIAALKGSEIRTLADLRQRVRVDKKGCWVWRGYLTPAGYSVTVFRGKRVGAHRIAYLLKGGDPRVRVVRHRCDNRGCANPRHVLGGTQSQNIRDAMKRERMGLLSFTKARVIRRDYARGWTQVALANRFSVSRRTVRNVLTGRSWREDGAS